MHEPVNEAIYDGIIHRSVELNRLSGSVILNIYNSIDTLEDKIVLLSMNKLPEGLVPRHKQNNILKNFYLGLTSLVNKESKLIKEELLSDLRTLGVQEGHYIQNLLSKSIGKEVDLIPSETSHSINVNPVVMNSYVTHWVDSIFNKLVFDINEKAFLKVTRGEDFNQFSKHIKGSIEKGYSNGSFKKPKEKIRSLVNSSVSSITNEIRLRTYDANERLIKGIRWFSPFDSRTSITSIGLDGCSWSIPGHSPIGHSKVYPSHFTHWNSRSTYLPLFGDNVAVQEKNIETFSEWIGGRTTEEKSNILGPRKHRLWERGKITTSQLTDFNNRPLSIKELRDAYAT